MRYVGIDIAAETHVVAAVDDQRAVVLKPTSFTEDATGYQKLLELLGSPPRKAAYFGHRARGARLRKILSKTPRPSRTPKAVVKAT